MGSGSTGIAATLENFQFIGIELDKTYFDIANKRISSVQKQAIEICKEKSESIIESTQIELFNDKVDPEDDLPW